MNTITDQLHALKYITDTLSAARKDQLPQVIPSLTNHLIICSEILCSEAKNPQILVHKLRTQISSLLQDKSLQGRWAAVVLVKTTIECVVRHQEGWEFLRTSTAWIRGLLPILGKPDPSPTKTITLVTLTRIFLLTHGQPSLTREITTPYLTSFVTACLNLIVTNSIEQKGRTTDQSNALLETVLQCLIRLLPNHSATFRPFVNQIRSLISPLVAPTPSDLSIVEERSALVLSQSFSALARHLHALLPSCAAKNGASEEWKKYVLIIIKQVNHTTDSAYRSVLDRSNNAVEASEEPADQTDDDLMLIGWHGVTAGCERIQGLLLLLSSYLSTKGTMIYQAPIKAIYEIIERLLSVGYPQSLVVGAHTEEINRQFTREERESVYMMLPHVHTATLDVLSVMISRMSLLSFGIAEDLLEQVAWMAQRSFLTAELRSSVYKVMEQIVGMIGTSIPPQESASINIVVRMACKDLIPETRELHALNTTPNGSVLKPDYNVDTFMSTTMPSLRKATTLQTYQKNALGFLSTTLLRVSASTLSSVRPKIDQVAVLLQDEKLQLTSILNPPAGPRNQNANLVPFLAKSHGPFVEALIHRRIGAVDSGEDNSDDDGAEPETNNIPLEPSFAVPTFNSDLTSSFHTVNRPGPQDFTMPTEDAEIVNAKRTAQSIDLDNVTSQVEEIEHTKKKSRLQETENEASSIVAPSSIAQSDVVAKAIEVEVPTSTLDKEATTMELDAVNSDSDDSFEIPEIVVDLDDEDSEEEE